VRACVENLNEKSHRKFGRAANTRITVATHVCQYRCVREYTPNEEYVEFSILGTKFSFFFIPLPTDDFIVENFDMCTYIQTYVWRINVSTGFVLLLLLLVIFSI
jgi:hypothetical protein